MASGPIKTGRDVMGFLLEFVDFEKVVKFKYNDATFDLGRVHALMAEAGDPHRRFRSIHIAGTKGKGSTARMIQSVLTTAGLRTGLFTSPHLVRLEERVTVDGELIPEASLVRFAERLRPYTEQAREERPGDSPTFFELVTAMGFMHFAESAVDCAVVEVGMGGRLDSTNVVLPEVSVITRIDLDHTDRLGTTLDRIAFEKGGIIKPRVPVVVAPQEPLAEETLKAIALERGAPMTCLGDKGAIKNACTSLAGDGAFCTFDLCTPKRSYPALRLPLLGAHQAENAAAAVAALEIFAERSGLAVPESALRDGLAAATCPARLEFFPGAPDILLDGAHNPVSIRVLRKVLDSTLAGRPVTLVMSVAEGQGRGRRPARHFAARRARHFHPLHQPPRHGAPGIAPTRGGMVHGAHGLRGRAGAGA